MSATSDSSVFRCRATKTELGAFDPEMKMDLHAQMTAWKHRPRRKAVVSENSAEVTRTVVKCFAAAMTDCPPWNVMVSDFVELTAV